MFEIPSDISPKTFSELLPKAFERDRVGKTSRVPPRMSSKTYHELLQLLPLIPAIKQSSGMWFSSSTTNFSEKKYGLSPLNFELQRLITYS